VKTPTYPDISVQEIECPKCHSKQVEHGGYRVRKLRTLEGIQEPKVLKLRCRNCKKHLRSVYPEDTPRASWYSQRVHAVMTVLSTHHVNEGCREEIADILGYPLTLKTHQGWQESRARRIEQQERQQERQQEQRQDGPEVASIDECKLGSSWAYTVTDTATDYVCTSALSERRNLFVVRDLVAEVEPKAVISDGCKSIEAGLHWFPKIPHGRCWFHVMQDVCRKVKKEDRPKLVADLQVLYENETLPAAERWLRHLMDCYDTTILMPLMNAWQSLKWWWKLPAMPLTNNTSEHLYGNLWPREKKRDKRSDTRKQAWLTEALWRHNHKPVDAGKSPFEAFFGLPATSTSLNWLERILPRPHTTFT
jgi:predicted nucleic-acid-binding Zn-ribbon protein